MSISATSAQLEPEFQTVYELLHVLRGNRNNSELLQQIIELLGSENNRLEDFLERLLIKLNELIPSELLFIGLVTETAEGLRVVIRDRNRHRIGAVKGKEESLAPDFAIGGEELPESDRSLTGYVASTKQTIKIGNVQKWKEETGLYRVAHSRIRSEVAVPILFEDRDVLGVINLESICPDHYRDEDIKQIQWVARLISRPLYAMMNRAGFRRPSLAVLDKIFSDLSELRINADLSMEARKYLSEDSRDVFNSLAAKTAHALSSESCQVWILTEDRSQLVLEGEYKPSIGAASIIKCSDDLRSEQAMKQRTLLTFGPSDNSSEEPLMIAPLLAGDQVYGVIKVTSPTQRPHGGMYYTSGDERMLTIIQQAIAAQIHVKHLEWRRRAEALKRQEDVNVLLDVLSDISVYAGSEDSVEPILKQTCERIMSMCDAPHCSIFLLDESNGRFVRRASSPLPKGFINKKSYALGEGFTGWVAKNGKPLILQSRRDQDLSHISPRVPWKNKQKQLNPQLLDRPYIAVPIRLKGKQIGVIRCTDKRGVQPTFTEADEQILSL
ncbi:MAG TPA: GAF domain-containing protein, partial [Candidatus Saccharimonadales bacterium]|nr:GAF domain-containing protein [Candidatus Saccharimonadales bacterium]